MLANNPSVRRNPRRAAGAAGGGAARARRMYMYTHAPADPKSEITRRFTLILRFSFCWPGARELLYRAARSGSVARRSHDPSGAVCAPVVPDAGVGGAAAG